MRFSPCNCQIEETNEVHETPQSYKETFKTFELVFVFEPENPRSKSTARRLILMLEILWNKASRIRNAMLATKPTKPNKEPKLHAELSLLYKHFPLCHPFADIHPNTTTEQI